MSTKTVKNAKALGAICVIGVAGALAIATASPLWATSVLSNPAAVTTPVSSQVTDVQYSPPQACGGIAGIKCPDGQTCVDDPNDSCDPAHGGADCPGICKAKYSPPQACGGIAGIKCPDGQTCVDDPNDSCDPAHGGADCSGICKDK